MVLFQVLRTLLLGFVDSEIVFHFSLHDLLDFCLFNASELNVVVLECLRIGQLAVIVMLNFELHTRPGKDHTDVPRLIQIEIRHKGF